MTTSPVALSPFASASAMLAALAARECSSVELLDFHLDRIARYNPALNAIVIPNTDAARRRAAEADAQRARGEPLGALHGLPLTIKDCIGVGGLRATGGVEAWAENLCAEDSPVAARVLGAGAVLMGKTNVPPYAGDWQSVNPIFGRTVNPWDHRRTPGGSSGGSAAALAAGLTPLEFGSDIGGSIRIPAAFCGLHGHRPSETLVPRSGHVPGAPLPNPAAVMGVQGPLARTAADLALALDVIAGPEVGEDVAWRVELPPARHERLGDFRVAVLPSIDWLPVDREIVARLDDLAARLAHIGATVAVAALPGWDARAHHERYLSLLDVMMLGELPPEGRAGVLEKFRASSDPFAAARVRGVSASSADLMHLLGAREAQRAAYRAFFREWDILLAPITLTAAFPHDDAPFDERSLTVNGEAVAYTYQVVYPGVATFSGQPATAFPIGRSGEGLPLGLQAIGPYLEDRTPLRFAALLEAEYGGFTPPPGYEE